MDDIQSVLHPALRDDPGSAHDESSKYASPVSASANVRKSQYSHSAQNEDQLSSGINENLGSENFQGLLSNTPIQTGNSKRSKVPRNYRRFIQKHYQSLTEGKKRNWIYSHYRLVGKKESDSADSEDPDFDYVDVFWVCRHCGRQVVRESKRYENNVKLKHHLGIKGLHGPYFWDSKGCRHELADYKEGALRDHLDRSKMVYYEDSPRFPFLTHSFNEHQAVTNNGKKQTGNNGTDDVKTAAAVEKFIVGIFKFVASTGISWNDVLHRQVLRLLHEKITPHTAVNDSIHRKVTQFKDEIFDHYRSSTRDMLQNSDSRVCLQIEHWDLNTQETPDRLEVFALFASYVDRKFKTQRVFLEAIILPTHIYRDFDGDTQTKELLRKYLSNRLADSITHSLEVYQLSIENLTLAYDESRKIIVDACDLLQVQGNNQSEADERKINIGTHTLCIELREIYCQMVQKLSDCTDIVCGTDFQPNILRKALQFLEHLKSNLEIWTEHESTVEVSNISLSAIVRILKHSELSSVSTDKISVFAFPLLSSLLSHRDAIRNYESHFANEDFPRFSCREWAYLMYVVQILSPFHELLVQFRDPSTCISQVIYGLHSLVQHLQQYRSVSTQTVMEKEINDVELTSYLTSTISATCVKVVDIYLKKAQNPLYLTACLLSPNHVKYHLDSVQEFLSSNDTLQLMSKSPTKQIHFLDDVYFYLRNAYPELNIGKTDQSTVFLQQYLEEVKAIQFDIPDVSTFWRTYGERWPVMAGVARDLLAIPLASDSFLEYFFKPRSLYVTGIPVAEFGENFGSEQHNDSGLDSKKMQMTAAAAVDQRIRKDSIMSSGDSSTARSDVFSALPEDKISKEVSESSRSSLIEDELESFLRSELYRECMTKSAIEAAVMLRFYVSEESAWASLVSMSTD